MKTKIFKLFGILSVVLTLASCEAEYWDFYTPNTFTIEDEKHAIKNVLVTQSGDEFTIELLSDGLVISDKNTVEGTGASFTLVVKSSSGISTGTFDYGASTENQVWTQGYYTKASGTKVGVAYGTLIVSKTNSSYDIELLTVDAKENRIALKYTGSIIE